MSEDPLRRVQSELASGISLAKCRKCDCMKKTLEAIHGSLSAQNQTEIELLKNVKVHIDQMEQIEYDCLGCKYCYPAVAWKNFAEYKNKSF